MFQSLGSIRSLLETHRRVVQSPEPANKRPYCGPFPFILQCVSIEQSFEKGLLPLGMTTSVRLSVTSIMALIMLRLQKGGLQHRSSGWRVLGTSLDDLVEFPTIEPNTPALGRYSISTSCRTLITRETPQTGHGIPAALVIGRPPEAFQRLESPYCSSALH
jgi:hypothetical protein